MSQAPSVAFAVVDVGHVAVAPANVSLKGTARGLEILVVSAPSAAALAARLTELLAEAPSFFAGSDARVTFEGALPVGALARLEEVATRFQLNLVEIGPAAARRPRTYAAVVRRDDVRRVKLAEGTGPIAEGRGPAPSPARIAQPAPSASAQPAPSDAMLAAARDAASAASIEAASPASIEAASPASIEAASAAAGDAASPASIEDAAVEPPEAAPIEVALANTAPYCIIDVNEAAAHDANAAARAQAAHASNDAAAPAQAAHASNDAAAAQAAHASNDAAAPAQAAPALDAAPPLDAAPALDAAPPLDTASPLDAATPLEPASPLEAAAAIEAAVAHAVGAAAMAAELGAAMPPGPRLVIGPVRSGVIVDHAGHVVVIGDVNPGAEVRAEGSIIVLGRMRGVAHAAICRDAGFIVALSLQPQQLRIGRMVARAGDADRPSDGAEIAYVTGEAIVVERFLGRLPSGLAASM